MSSQEERYSPKNANDLNKALIAVFADLRNKKISTEEALASSAVIDKVIKNVKNQIDYKKVSGSKEKISFLENDGE